MVKYVSSATGVVTRTEHHHEKCGSARATHVNPRSSRQQLKEGEREERMQINEKIDIL